MCGASVEATLELWACSLRDAKARMRPLFAQERMARSAELFLDGLLGPERRKTGWMRAEAAGDPGPWRQQAVLGRGRWDADALRDVVREYALETLADPEAVLVEAEEYVDGAEGLCTRGLLIRRHLADGELACFSTWCAAGTAIETLVQVEGHRWAIEDAFETSKNELGLDHNETRSWHGWHRHISPVMLAFAILAVTRHHANIAADQTPTRVSRRGAHSSAGPSKTFAALLRASPSAASDRRSSSPGQPSDALTRPTQNELI